MVAIHSGKLVVDWFFGKHFGRISEEGECTRIELALVVKVGDNVQMAITKTLCFVFLAEFKAFDL